MDHLKGIQKEPYIKDLASTKEFTSSRYMLALDAIKQINEQVVDSTDLHRLMNLVLFTLAGQFAVPNAFMILYDMDEQGELPILIGVGDLEHSATLDNPDFMAKVAPLMLGKDIPIRVQDLKLMDETTDVVKTLLAKNITLLVPVRIKDVIIGVVGLGQKANGRHFLDDTINLLTAIMNTIAPILSLQSKEFFNLFRSSSQAVFILNQDFILQKANKVALALIDNHIDAEQGGKILSGRSISELFPPSIYPGWAKAVTNMDPDSNINHIRSLELYGHDEKRYFEMFVSKINIRSRKSYLLMMTLEDVSEKRATAQRLSQMQNAAERGMMLSSIAHEINNYLGVMVGGLELMDVAAKTGDLQKIKKHLGNLVQGCVKIGNFSSDLVGKTRHKTIKSLSNLNTIIKRSIEFIKLQKRFQGIELQFQPADELPLILIDEDEISQLLLNMANNASDAIKTINKNGIVGIRTSFNDHHINLEITDTGPGIPPEILNRLFKENLTTKIDGHGFGLTVSAQILKNHNAKYHIESDLGSGTLFRFTFPLNL